MESRVISIRTFLFCCFYFVFSDLTFAEIEQVSDSYSIGSGTHFIDAVPSKNLVLYLSYSGLSLDPDESESDEVGELYIVDTEAGTHVSLTKNKDLFEYNTYRAEFIADGHKVFLTTYQSWSLSSLAEAFIYDIADNSFTKLDISSLENTAIRKMETSAAGNVIYFSDQSETIIRLEVDTGEFIELDLPTRTNGWECDASFIVASQVDKLVLFCGSEWFIYQSDGQWSAFLPEGVSLGYSEPLVLSGDGKRVFFNYHASGSNGDMRAIDIEEQTGTKKHLLDDPIISSYYLVEANDDGNYVLVSTGFTRSAFDDFSTSLYLRDNQTGKGAFVGLYNSFLENAVFSSHGFFDDYFYFSSSHASIGNITYRVKLSELFSVPQTDIAADFTLNSAEPLTVDLTFESGAVPARLHRRGAYSAKSRHFFAGSQEIRENRHGLSAKTYDYEYYPCNKLYYCSEAPAITKSIAVQDFPTPPVISIEYSANQNDPSKAGLTRVSAQNLGPDASVRITTYGDSDGDSNTTSITHGNRHHAIYYAQYCRWDSMSTQYGCGSRSQPVDVRGPLDRVDVNAKLLPDLSAVRIDWPENYATVHKLYRVVGEVAKLIYEGTDTSFLDEENLFGEQVLYRVLSCNDIGCSHNDSPSFAVARPRHPISISAQTIYRLRTNQLYITTGYVFDEIKIFRTSAGGGSKVELAKLPGDTKVFRDDVNDAGESWIYEAHGCFEGDCSFESLTSKSDFHYVQDITPSTPQNIVFDSERWHLAGNISWDLVDNADGYEIEMEVRSNIPGAQYNRDKLVKFVVDGNVNSYAFHYKEHIGHLASITVKSYVRSSKGETFYSAPSDSILVNLFHSDEIPNDIFPPTFTFVPSDINRQYASEFLFDTTPAFSYFVHIKQAADESYSVHPVKEGNRTPFFPFYHYPPENLQEPITFDYKMRVCSDFLDKCVWFSNEQQRTFYPNYDLTNVNSAPVVSINESGNIVISPQDSSEYEFSYLSVGMRVGNGEQSIYNGSYKEAIEYLPYDIEPGKSYTFTTRSCMTIETQRRTYPRGHQCTEFSEPATIEIPPDYSPIPVEQLSLSLTTSEGYPFQVSLRSRRDYWRTDWHQRFDVPTYLRVWRAINGGPFVAIADASFSDYVASENGTFYVDTDLQSNRYVSYMAQYCNESGCGERSEMESVSVPNFTDIGMPRVPLVSPYFSEDFNTDKRVLVELEKSVERLIVRASPERDDLSESRTRSFNTWQFLSLKGIINITDSTGLNRFSRPWVSAMACNLDLCSDWSEPIEALSGQHEPGSFSIAGAAWRDIDFGGYNDKGTIFTKLSGSGVASRYQEADTFQGYLLNTSWFYQNEATVFESGVYLNPDQNHSCKTLFSQGVGLKKKPGLGGDRELSVAHSIMNIIYTGNGCASEKYPELFSYYIDSDMLDAPILVADKSQFERRWLNVNIRFDDEQKALIDIDGQDLIVSGQPMSFDVFNLVNLFWKTDGNAALSRIAASTADMPDSLSGVLNPWQDFREVDAFHPTALAFIDDHFVSQVFTVNAWQYQDTNPQFAGTFQFVGSAEQTYQVVTGLDPESESTFLFNRCESTQCGPYFTSQVRLPAYGTMRPFGKPRRSSVQEQPGEIILEVIKGHSNGYPDTVTLLQRSEEETEYREVITDSYVQVISTHSRSQIESNTLGFSVANLNANLTYKFKLNACNDKGCSESSASNWMEVPVDGDGDGVVDEEDAFPENPDEWLDTDGDGVGNNADDDDDNDGIPDAAELAMGLDPVASWDARVDLDSDGFNNLMEYLAGSDIENENESPQSLGRFYSFEEGVIDEELDVSEGIVMQQSAWHGNHLLSTFASQESMDIVVSGVIKPGSTYFAVRNYTDTFSYEAKLDGQNIEIGDPIPVYQPVKEFGWFIYPIAIKQDAKELVLSFQFGTHRRDGGWSFDGLFVPGVETNMVKADFDGDGKAELALRDSRNSMNHVLNLESSEQRSTRFGLQAADIPVNGDFDGDGKADIAVRRPSNQMWYVLRSSDGEIARHHFGRQEEDIPVPADYDGDGITDIAVRRPSNTMWYILRSSDGEIERHKFGLQAEDIPVPADYDGDGKADIAVRRANNQMWYILRSSDGEIERHKFGLQEADIPVPADYDGDGKADIAVRRANNRMWYIKQSSDAQIQRVKFGLQELDIPVISDYDGDGKADIAVRRPSTHFWYVLNSSDDSITRNDFGREPEYVPVTAPITIRMNMVSAIAAESGQDKAEDNKADTEWDYFQELYEMKKELTGIER